MKPLPQESELCLSEVELERLINGTHSLEMLGKIIAFASGSACQLVQYLRIISMLYDKLDVNKIPYCIVGTDGVTVTNVVEALDFAFTALIGLGTTIRL
ncbi:hypothetical protein JVT61DRAFT_8870 [Boletus reticuloceps]|uniref:Uncharacterized protein n=1 Tax=Boletus reticuloceps TaxID=495285 RepID=A0A8I2YHJ0_9AGAM|nr:hypothetical protein JVT61DRAFT_8870 [Boletus reticuloceps]